MHRRIRVPHSSYVRNGRVVVERCQHVGRDHVRVGSGASEGEVVPFDFLLICTGTHYAENLKAESPSLEYRIRQYESERRSLAAAERVLIIGGGVVAMETAGDVHDAFPNKEIIIVCRSTLLRKSGPLAHVKLKEFWEGEGARIVEGEAMLPLGPGATTYRTEKGTAFPVEGTRAIWCTGRGQPCTGFMPDTSLDEYGYIRTNKYCQVEGFPQGNVFAAGDCVYAAAHPQADRGVISGGIHGFVARENIVAMAKSMNINMIRPHGEHEHDGVGGSTTCTTGTPTCTSSSGRVVDEALALSPPHKMPFPLDQDLQETGFGKEGAKMFTLGLTKVCSIMTPGGLSKKGADLKSKKQNFRIIRGLTGGKARMMVDWCDGLRDPDAKFGMMDMNGMALGKASDYKGTFSSMNFLVNHTSVGQFATKMMLGMKPKKGDEAHAMPVPDLAVSRPEYKFGEGE